MKILLTSICKEASLIGMLLLFSIPIFSNGPGFDKKMVSHQDSIISLLEKAELEKATILASSYFDWVKSNFTMKDYHISVDLRYSCYRRQNLYSKAFTFLDNELKWAIEINNPSVESIIRYFLGLLFLEINENEKAIEYFLQVMDALEKVKFDHMTEQQVARSKIKIRFHLGEILCPVDPSKTLKYFDEAKLIAQAANDSVFLADSYLNMAWALLEMHRFDEGEEFLDTAMTIFDKVDSKNGQVSVFLEKGILAEHKSDYDEVELNYLKSFDMLFKGEIEGYQSYFLQKKALKLLTEMYMNREDNDAALGYALEYFNLTSNYKDRKQIAYITNKIAKIFEAKNDEDQALQFYKLSNENYEILKFEDARMDVLKQEVESSNNRKKEEVQGLKSTLKSKERNLIFIVYIGLSLGLILIYIFKKIRERELENEELIKASEVRIYKKNLSMAHLSLINQSKNQFIDYMKEKLQSIHNQADTKSPELENLIFQMKKSSNKEEEWLRIRQFHSELEPDFYNELQKRWPNLTILEIRHCTLIKLKMSNKEAAEILGVSPKSVQMARYRLKKKLNYSSQIPLREFVASI